MSPNEKEARECALTVALKSQKPGESVDDLIARAEKIMAFLKGVKI